MAGATLDYPIQPTVGSLVIRTSGDDVHVTVLPSARRTWRMIGLPIVGLLAAALMAAFWRWWPDRNLGILFALPILAGFLGPVSLVHLLGQLFLSRFPLEIIVGGGRLTRLERAYLAMTRDEVPIGEIIAVRIKRRRIDEHVWPLECLMLERLGGQDVVLLYGTPAEREAMRQAVRAGIDLQIASQLGVAPRGETEWSPGVPLAEPPRWSQVSLDVTRRRVSLVIEPRRVGWWLLTMPLLAAGSWWVIVAITTGRRAWRWRLPGIEQHILLLFAGILTLGGVVAIVATLARLRRTSVLTLSRHHVQLEETGILTPLSVQWPRPMVTGVREVDGQLLIDVQGQPPTPVRQRLSPEARQWFIATANAVIGSEGGER